MQTKEDLFDEIDKLTDTRSHFGILPSKGYLHQPEFSSYKANLTTIFNKYSNYHFEDYLYRLKIIDSYKQLIENNLKLSDEELVRYKQLISDSILKANKEELEKYQKEKLLIESQQNNIELTKMLDSSLF